MAVNFLKLILCLLITTSAAFGQTTDLFNLFKGVKTLKITFSQITKLPVAGDEVSLYKGVIYYKRPLKFRWEYTQGAKVLIVSDGKLVKSSVEGECQVGELSPETLFPLIELIENPKGFKMDFLVKEIKREGNWEAIKIVPKYKDPFFKEVTFILKDGKLVAVETLQEDGTQAKYRIEKIVKNLPLKDSLFRVTPCR